MRWVYGVTAALVVGALACTTVTVVAPPDGGGDAGDTSDAGSPADSGTRDSAVDSAVEASADAAVPCVGACATTTLEANFGGIKRTLERAQFGTETRDAGQAIHLEAHAGGEPACPTGQSPTPDRTMIVAGVPRGARGRTLTHDDGVKASLLDFDGALGLPPITRSTAASVTVVAEDTTTPPAWIALDLVATFAEGTVTGHIYATFCTSLSD